LSHQIFLELVLTIQIILLHSRRKINTSFWDCQFEILKFADEKRYAVDTQIEETVSITKKVEDRKLGKKRNAKSLSVYLRTNRGDTLYRYLRGRADSFAFIQVHAAIQKRLVSE